MTRSSSGDRRGKPDAPTNWVLPKLIEAHLLYGEWLRREARRVDAREQLRTAHRMFTDMGMEAFAERARRELLATGETIRKRRAETRDELPPQEWQIPRLAREALSNPETGERLFLSPRAVEWHLKKVFTKLEMRSRMGLHDALPERDRQANPRLEARRRLTRASTGATRRRGAQAVHVPCLAVVTIIGTGNMAAVEAAGLRLIAVRKELGPGFARANSR